MAANELDILLQQGEGYNIEFKQSITKDIPQEICAFVNAAGGTLLIGVKDDNTICGVKVDNSTRSRVMDSLRVIDPRLDIEYKELQYNDKKIISLVCKTGRKKPYTLSGAIYIRIGPNSQKITSVEEMRDFFQQSERIYFDESLCPDFSFPNDFDEMAFTKFLILSGISTAHATQTILENLKLRGDNGDLKNGAILFFGKKIQSYFETAFIRCVCYKGDDKRYIIDDKYISGNLLQQYEESVRYIYTKLNLSYDIESQGTLARKETWEIPEIVFKEALINALTHRDYYDKGAPTMIEIFDDRIEITNPGALVNSIPRSQFGKRSISRNPLLFGLFSKIKLVEQVGSGIARMRSAMIEANLQEPEFNVEGMFSVSFKRPPNFAKWFALISPQIGKTRSWIIELVHRNPSISKSAMAKTIGISTTAIDKHILYLRTNGLLHRIGPDRNGQWHVTPTSQSRLVEKPLK